MKTWLYCSLDLKPESAIGEVPKIALRSRLWHGAIMSDQTPKSAPNPLSWRRFSLLGGLIPAILVAIDQVSKWATTRFFDLPMGICAKSDPKLTHEVSPIVDLSLLCNRGISWGLLQGDSSLKRWALTAFAFAMTLALLYVLRKTQDRLGQISLSLVIAGAVGNAVDRLLFGAVTDMIDFSDIKFNYVFNVADSYITVGVTGLFLSTYLTEKRAKADAKTAVE